MQKIKDYIENAKILALERNTFYDNTFPYNCLYVHENGAISGDCIGMIKGLINRPDIVDCYTAGQYAVPGTTIPDLSERGIYNECSEKSSDFCHIPIGAYLEMDSIVGHAGLYVGDFLDGEIVNVIEFTVNFNGGCTTSYVDSYGRRYDHKGGTYTGLNWERFGKMTKWLDYSDSAKQLVIDGECGKDTITAFQTIAKKDYPEIIIDGEISGQNRILCDIYFPSAVPSAFDYSGTGSITVEVIQKICAKNGCYNGAITGIWDYLTADGLQYFLSSNGYQISDPPGVFARESCKQWQRFLNSLMR